jgi:hypothetical protein
MKQGDTDRILTDIEKYFIDNGGIFMENAEGHSALAPP